MQRSILSSLVSLLILILWSGCSVESVTPDNTPKTVTTTVAGQVVDEFGKPVQGAQVAAYGKSAVTNQYGTFLIKGVESPEERTLVKVSKSGYFDGFCAEQPVAGGVTQMRIGLMGSAAQGKFPATAGRTVSAFFSTATVSFPPNAYVAEGGTTYTGEVSYVVRHLDPSANNFYDFFAGDFQGVRADGTTTQMISYGVLRVELRGASGEKLNLAAGKTATLSFPLSDKMAPNFPPEMPLWSFDEAKGMWKEEGKATMQGNMYVGKVSHFSDWNCDVPAQTATLRVRVTCGSEGVAGALVRIGQRTAITDSNGYVSRRVPEGMAFSVKVHPESNDGLESAEIAAGPFAAGTVNQADIPLTKCPAYVKGNVYDCGDSPIDATVIAEYATGGFAFGFAQNGGFRFRVKSGTGIIIKAFTAEGKESDPTIVPPLISVQNYDVGILNACKTSSIAIQDYDVNTTVSVSPALKTTLKLLLSADGTKAFLFNEGTATVVHTTTGEVIRTIAYSTPAKLDSLNGTTPFDISSDGSLMLVGVEYAKYALYDVASGNKIRDFSNDYLDMTLSPDGSYAAGYKYVIRNPFPYTDVAIVNTATGNITKQFQAIDGMQIQAITQFTDFLTNNSLGIMQVSGGLKVVETANFHALQTINVSYNTSVVAQSNDGSVIAVSGGKEVTFYNTRTGAKMGGIGFSQQNYYSTSLGTTLNNDIFVAQLIDNSGKYSQPSLFAVASGQFIKPLPAISNVIYYYGLQFSADGKKLVGAYIENNRLKLRVWKFQ